MSQTDFIRNIAKFGLENDQEKLLSTLNDLIEHSKQTKKLNFAIQLQSVVKEAIRQQQTSGIFKVGGSRHTMREEDRELNELILEKVTSDYNFSHLVSSKNVSQELSYFVQEHSRIDLLRRLDLPISNKILLYGPPGCGKTLTSYVIAGELGKMMMVVNLGAIVSSKLGDTSKNLSKIFRKAALEGCILFLDEFDTLGKLRDYSQDHGEMKRVVNTLLQLFDYLPQDTIVIAATNQSDMIDPALLRRFDVSLKMELPKEEQIKVLITNTLKGGNFRFDKPKAITSIVKDSVGLSFYSIKKSLITAAKRSLFSLSSDSQLISPVINTSILKEILEQEKELLVK